MAIGTTAAVIGGASLLGAGASIIGGSKAASAQSRAANTAADAQVQAARIASDTQRQMFDQTRSDAEPFMLGGRNALAALSNEMGLGIAPSLAYQTEDGKWTFQGAIGKFNTVREAEDAIRRSGNAARYQGFEASPGYAFMRDQGTQTVDRSAAARGMLRSGATMKAQERFGQGIAAQEYGNYLSRLGSMAGIGQTSTGQIGALGTSVAGQIGNNAMMAGQGSANAALTGGAARASAYQNAGIAVNNLAGNALGAAAFGGYLSPGGGFSAPSAGRFSNALY